MSVADQGTGVVPEEASSPVPPELLVPPEPEPPLDVLATQMPLLQVAPPTHEPPAPQGCPRWPVVEPPPLVEFGLHAAMAIAIETGNVANNSRIAPNRTMRFHTKASPSIMLTRSTTL